MIDPILAGRAVEYARTRNLSLDLTKKLGSGQDGCVLRSDRKTAVKAFERIENYHNERESYQRLAAAKITRLGVFAIPSLVGFSEPHMIVEMSIVSPPYLIDFGKAYIDRRPDYPEDTLVEWEAQCVEFFGDRWPEVRMALASLRRLGIHYMDAKPANITFGASSAIA